MSKMKKAARIGSGDLTAGIAAAKANAKARVEKIEGEDVSKVGGGIDVGGTGVGSVIDVATWGMKPPEPTDPWKDIAKSIGL